MGAVLKETGNMRQPKALRSQTGFTLLETMIALIILAVGVLGLAGMLANALAYMQGSQDDFIAQQKAEEAAEAIFTAKYTNNATFAQISNNTAGNTTGLFLTGPVPLTLPGPDGLVGSINDGGAPSDYVVYPGPDGKLGTADDLKVPLSNFTRTITISNIAGEPNLRTIAIEVDYRAGSFTRKYILNTEISAF
jgi:prepilin-type N-terminal cleavage/methylation domain-containing protein